MGSQQTGHVLMSRILGYEQKRHFFSSPNKWERYKGEDAVFKTQDKEALMDVFVLLAEWEHLSYAAALFEGITYQEKIWLHFSRKKHIPIIFRICMKSLFCLFFLIQGSWKTSLYSTVE